MRLSQALPKSLSLLAILLFSTCKTYANPLARDSAVKHYPSFGLEQRAACDGEVCGWQGQLCCHSDEYCYTDKNEQAQCGKRATAVGVLTATVASSQATAAPVAGVCNVNLNEVSCGTKCCPSGQFCAYAGQCAPYATTTNAIIPAVGPTTVIESNSAFIRPTSATTATVIATGTVTTTVPFVAPTSTNGSDMSGITSNNSISGGSVAGIVVGVLLGIFLLILLLLFCCFRALFDAIFGRKRRVEETYIEERHSHHSGSRPGRTWFGIGGRPSGTQEKESGGAGGLLKVGAILAGLAVVLGLKRKRDRRDEEEEERMTYTESSYTYSDYTSASSESSRSDDRHTRHTRDTRRSSRR